jgi:hypothetical protein
MSSSESLDFDVTGLAATTVVTVRALWEDMGMKSEDQDGLLAGLVQSARGVFSKFSEEQTATKQTMVDFINNARSKTTTLAKNMHLQEEKVRDTAGNGSHDTLVTQRSFVFRRLSKTE